MISPVFWIYSGEYGFQKVGRYWRVYNRQGDFSAEFRSFENMCDWIIENEGKETEKND